MTTEPSAPPVLEPADGEIASTAFADYLEREGLLGQMTGERLSGLAHMFLHAFACGAANMAAKVQVADLQRALNERFPLTPRKCGHCGRGGARASADGVPLCHPDDPTLPDCYRRVTVYGEPVGALIGVGPLPAGVRDIVKPEGRPS